MAEENDTRLIESACRFVQECFSGVPVIVLGCGHSSAYGIPGMDELASYLRSEVPKSLHPKDKSSWDAFEQAIQSKSLEIVLQEIQTSSELITLIIEKTWECIYPFDKKVLEGIISNTENIPLSRLYRHLFNSTRQRIQLITTNYDCIAEYAADTTENVWSTGFGYGYIGKRYGTDTLTIAKGSSAFRTVDIWKVHGSINWYRSPDATTYYLPTVSSPPTDYTSVIVTPGIDKYKRTHEEPFRSIISGADSAMENAESFLCIGYGFNDEHIQPKLLEKCKKEAKAIVILAKELTPAAKKELLSGQCKNFIAFEETDLGTRMFNPEHLKGVDLPGENLWKLDGLLDRVL